MRLINIFEPQVLIFRRREISKLFSPTCRTVYFGDSRRATRSFNSLKSILKQVFELIEAPSVLNSYPLELLTFLGRDKIIRTAEIKIGVAVIINPTEVGIPVVIVTAKNIADIKTAHNIISFLVCLVVIFNISTEKTSTRGTHGASQRQVIHSDLILCALQSCGCRFIYHVPETPSDSSTSKGTTGTSCCPYKCE